MQSFRIFAVLLALSLTSIASAQMEERTTSLGQTAAVRPVYFGAGGAIGVNQHSLDMPVYKGSVLCGEFKSGSGLTPNFHLVYEASPSSWPAELWLSPRLHFRDLSADFSAPAIDNGRVRDPIDSSLVEGSRENRIDATIRQLGLDLFARYNVDKLVYLFGGPTVGILLNKNAMQREVIISPPNGIFDESGTNVREVSSGDIAGASPLQIAVSAGGGIDFPLSPKTLLGAEVAYSFPISKISPESNWNAGQLRFGLHLKFDITPERPQPKLDTFVATPEPRTSTLAATVRILGLDNGREFDAPTIRVEEFVSRDAYPVLNSVFFDNGSSTIPNRYRTTNTTQTIDSAALRGKSVGEVYVHNLDLLGARLRSNPNVTATIEGQQISTETVEIASARAETVASYLSSTWGIDRSRLRTTARVVEPQTTILDEEARKVDIVPSSPEVLDPLVLESITRTMNPPKLRIRTTMQTNGIVDRSTLTLAQGESPLATFNRVLPVTDWPDDPLSFPLEDKELTASLEVSDNLGGRVTATDSRMVQQITVRRKRAEQIADREVERYNLITFEFDKSTLDERSRRIVDQIAQNVTASDAIQVEGYTDVLGEEGHNLELATARANSVREALRTAIGARSATVDINARGVGEKNLVDNTLPEGRQLSRTVQITVTRPIAQR